MAAQSMNYIACDVPEGMRLGAWRAKVRPPRKRSRLARVLHRSPVAKR